MKEITKEIEVKHDSMGWDKKGVYLRVYYGGPARRKTIGRIYISKEITWTDSNIFSNEKPDGSMGIYHK